MPDPIVGAWVVLDILTYCKYAPGSALQHANVLRSRENAGAKQ